MKRIFISAGHFLGDPGATTALNTTEAEEMIKTRDLLVQELELRGLEKDKDFFSVPDNIDLRPTIEWINRLARTDDVALELHGNAAIPSARGAEIYHIAGNNERKENAVRLLDALVLAVPGLRTRGAKPDTATPHGRLGFCRDIAIPSLLIELCFLTNIEDMELLHDRRDLFAKGLANGLMEWSNRQQESSETFPTIDIEIDGKIDEDKGILVNNNSFIPVDLVERLGISLDKLPNARLINQGNIVYIKAIELQEFNVLVSWNNLTKTVIIQTAASLGFTVSEKIMGHGSVSESRLKNFLEINNSDALNQFPGLLKLYIDESALEGINHDIAFCQMCLETGFLLFGGDVQPSQNNFCGLGATGGGVKGASFPNIQTGIKAHIQHLKAYASTEPVKHPPIVDPRFNLVERGVAPLVTNLSRRWATDPEYGTKILALQRQLLGIT